MAYVQPSLLMATFLKSVSNSGVEGREKMCEGKTQIQNNFSRVSNLSPRRDLVILSRVMTPGRHCSPIPGFHLDLWVKTA